mmetsp:Transcript_28013/g.80369  ORF Transcript_28013/g.80369 Transcript_28013/m.80369 type:complete len:211 (+) Transcript_28013:604-1236(+)
MAGIDHLAATPRSQGIDLFLKQFEKLIKDLLVHQAIVVCLAELAAEVALRADDLCHVKRQILCIRSINEARVLPAQLERDRCDVLRCQGKDLLGNGTAACEKDVVDGGVDELHDHFRPTLCDEDLPAREVLGNELRDEPGSGLGRLARFQHAEVACCHHAHKRQQTEQHRRIPRGDDEAHAFRFGHHLPITLGSQEGWQGLVLGLSRSPR